MAEGKECWTFDFVIEAVADVDIFAIEDTAALGAVVEEGWVVFEAVGKGQGQLARLRSVSSGKNARQGCGCE